LNNGTYTSISYPNATQTHVYGLNDLGEISGHDLGEISGDWNDTAGTQHGFYAVKQ
jgi:hypothetical protein